MNILLTTEVIHPGGAETFILRLSDALQKRGHNVHIFIFYKEMLNRQLCELFAPNVSISAAEIPASFLLRKIDGLLFRLKIDYSFREQYIKKALKKTIQEKGVEVVHSHLLKSDKVCIDVATQLYIPVVNTIHGDYLQFYNKTQNNIAIPLLNYKAKALNNLKNLRKVVCISDKQLDFFGSIFPKETNGKLTKIYNGYTGQVKEAPTALRDKLSIPQGDFVYGMVSRGIATKGWQVAIDAFIKTNKPNTHLVLVGDSDYLKELTQTYSNKTNIHFTGHADNPLDWINMMDVGLLPTTYPSESLPTVVIEYLCCAKPVIASNAGEIANMISSNNKKAGVIVPIVDDSVSTDAIADAMALYHDNKETYSKHKENALLCYKQFDMDKCLDAYCAVYNKSINVNA